ncbi:MAG: rRNA maturation RNase YbeY [Filifactor alocis]|uniref:rRNA maturation RNase YbeY n=1 Tax=Filifactor alocis TaxID=143361 RepID=UPI003FA0DD78
MIRILWEIEEYESDIDSALQKTLSDIIVYAMKTEHFTGDYEVSLSVVSADQIRELNANFRQIDRITDVLSFPMYEREELDEIEEKKEYEDYEVNIGDIVLCYDRAVEQAKEYGHSLKREICYLVTHSIFHLLGYDHMEEEEKQMMRTREEQVLSHFHILREE